MIWFLCLSGRKAQKPIALRTNPNVQMKGIEVAQDLLEPEQKNMLIQ
jgi:hypothetical protein